VAAGRFSRLMHRVHRALGSVLAAVIALWFSSGAVMTFASFPYLRESERLALAPPLPALLSVELPPELTRLLHPGATTPDASVSGQGLPQGAEVRLAMHEGQPTWLFDGADGPVARRAHAAFDVTPLSDDRVRTEGLQRLGLPVESSERLTTSDQWTVAIRPSVLPLHRVRFADSARTEAYFSERTGELVQLTTRGERTLAWLGAIPHWVYLTVLRRERALWRYTVLSLSVLGLALTLSGTAAGIHVWRTLRRRGAPPRDPYLRWHQALGLWFGLFASSWLFSGAMSLTPFHWTGDSRLTPAEDLALYGTPPSVTALDITAALHGCQRELDVRELTLRSMAGRLWAVCADGSSQTRLVDVADPQLVVRKVLPSARLRALAVQLTGAAAKRAPTLESRFDSYHYPTHSAPDAALPFVKIARDDSDQTTFYLDPARAQLLSKHTARTRLERWLYQGLHCFDWPGLYSLRVLWRTLMISAMVLGATLSGLGLAMVLRRLRRASQRRRRKEVATGQEVSAEVVFRE
jgi:hypothetical protein